MEIENHDILILIIGVILMKSIFADLKLLVYVVVPIILLYLYKTYTNKDNLSNDKNQDQSSNMYVSNYGNSVYYDNTLNQIKKERHHFLKK